MARGHSHTRPRGSVFRAAAARTNRTAGVRQGTPPPQPPAPTPAEAQELVSGLIAQVRAHTTTQIERTLDTFDTGDTPPLLQPSAGVGPDGSTRPGELTRAGLLAHAAGDRARARGYLTEAHRLLGQIVGAPVPFGALAWDFDASNASANADRALATAAALLRDDATLDRAVSEAGIRAHFGEPQRLGEQMLELIGEHALARREDVVHAMAIRYAEQEDPALAERVAAFDPQRIVTLSRVTRALTHDPRIIAGQAPGTRPHGLCMRVLEDIADDGRLWRGARLDGLVGAHGEREHLLLRGAHRRRRYRNGDRGAQWINTASGPGYLTRVAHRLRTAHAAGAPLRANMGSVGESLAQIVEEFASRPGRLRVRAARMTSDTATKQLMCEVIYEGLAEETAQPLRITMLAEVATSRQTSDAAQMRRVHEHLESDPRFACLPAPEEGFVQLEARGERTTLIAGPSEHAPLTPAPLDAHLGPEPTCAHTQCRWHTTNPYAILSCDGCGDELLRRPMWRLSTNRPRDTHGRDLAARRLTRVAAIAELNGEEPPGSLAQVLAEPPCDDWRREINAPTRPRSMSIGEAMRRR